MRISRSADQIAAHYDAIVVGSGYGGGVSASRLARMGYRVAVLERGEEIPVGEFPDTVAKAASQFQANTPSGHVGERTALFDLHTGDDMNVLVGCGLGGTSLINANVALEPDPRLFDDPLMPAQLRDDDLKAGYDLARAMLRPEPFPQGDAWPALNKLAAMKQAVEGMKVELVRPPINVSFTDGLNAAGVWQPACNLCGDCCSGCNTGAKTTTAMCYLPDAAAFGAEIYCGMRVDRVERGEGQWTVYYELQGLGRRTFDAADLHVSADMVVLAGGTLGSTEILLRSKANGLSLSDSLGTRFSGNGDVLAFGYNNDNPIDGIGMGHDAASYDWRTSERRPVGPTITGLIDLRRTEKANEGMVIEEGAIPGGVASLLPPVLIAAAAALGRDTDTEDALREAARTFESLIHGAYRGAVNHTQTFLVMAHDGADGQLTLNENRLQIDWPEVGRRPVFSRIADRLEQATAASGGTYLPNPIWTELMGHRLVTVHPLGGCPMGSDAKTGVVDDQCRVFSGNRGTDVHPGLYVCDGSVLPISLGVNPLLTISAISERAMIKLSSANNRQIAVGPPPPMAVEQQPTIGIRFTEKMAGETWEPGSTATSPASFVLTVIAADADRFMNDPAHLAAIAGTVELPTLSSKALVIESGRFNLFSSFADRVETRQMEYRLPLFAENGDRFYLHGRKYIHDDPGADLWHDSTTLEIFVRRGEDDSGELLLEGELHIAPMDLVRQLRTMTVTDAPDLASRLDMMRRFGFFFSGKLFESYGGPFARPSLYDGGTARLKRPLRTNEPEVHSFKTDDGLALRFTRYKGGEKGPVIFSHGLGVSSLIFTIDTIDTNMLEYMYADGFDCWVLDHRASIDLPFAPEQYSADALARFDYPAAVSFVRERTGRESVQMIAHCYGAMTFAMAMLDGLKGVRSAVISQIASHADVPFFPQRLIAFLRGPDLMRLTGAKLLDARATTQRDHLARFIDAGLAFAYPYRRDDRSRSATSRRITALYGKLYQLEQLNQATLDAMPEMFGKANIASFIHLAKIARKGHVIRADGSDDYVTPANLRRFAIPTLFIHGQLNRAFAPSGTAKTMNALTSCNGADLYERVVIPATGHIDCIFGKNAAESVYPHILNHLNRTC